MKSLMLAVVFAIAFSCPAHAGISFGQAGGKDDLGNHTATTNLDMSLLDVTNVDNISAQSIGSRANSAPKAPVGVLDLTSDIELTSTFVSGSRVADFDFNADTPGDSVKYTDTTIVNGDLSFFFDASRDGSSNIFTVSATADGFDGTSGLLWQQNLATTDFIAGEARIRLRRFLNRLSSGKQWRVFKVNGKVETADALTAHSLGTILAGDLNEEYRVYMGSVADGSRVQSQNARFGGNWFIQHIINGTVVDRIDSGVHHSEPVSWEFQKVVNGDEFIRILDINTKAVLAEAKVPAKDARFDHLDASILLSSIHFYSSVQSNIQPPIHILDDITYTFDRTEETLETRVEPAAPNPTDTVLVEFDSDLNNFGARVDQLVTTITPNDGTNNGATPVDLTTAELVELTNTGAVVGKTITITDPSGVRTLFTATGGGTTVMVDGGEGDDVIAEISGGRDPSDGSLSLRGVADSEFGTKDILGSTSTDDSADVLFLSGSVFGTGDSGDLISSPGLAPNGTRGKIIHADGSEGTIGHFWASTDVNGRGTWQAGVLAVEDSFTATFDGTSPVGAKTVIVRKTGKQVTLEIPAGNSTNPGANPLSSGATDIPAVYRPAADLMLSAVVDNDGSRLASRMEITAAGKITFFGVMSSGDYFGSTGGWDRISVTYTLP